MKNKRNNDIVEMLQCLIFGIALSLFCLYACTPAKQLPSPTLHDSVHIELREHIVTVHDTVTFTLPQQSLSVATRDSSSHLETDFAFSDASILSDGTLFHTLENKPQDLETPVETSFTVRDSIVYRDREVPVPTPYPVEKELTRWEKTKMEVGGIAIIIFLIWGCFKFWRFWKML